MGEVIHKILVADLDESAGTSEALREIDRARRVAEAKAARLLAERECPPDLLGPAVASNMPAALDAVLPSRGRPPGIYHDWWTYRIPPGFVGSYIVSVAAADCPSGYNGVFTLYVVPVP